MEPHLLQTLSVCQRGVRGAGLRPANWPVSVPEGPLGPEVSLLLQLLPVAVQPAHWRLRVRGRLVGAELRPALHLRPQAQQLRAQRWSLLVPPGVPGPLLQPGLCTWHLRQRLQNQVRWGEGMLVWV